MSIKTPEQLADEICNAQPSDWAAARWTMKPEDVRASIIAAIEADRAQREELSLTLPSGQTITVWVGTSDGDGSALVQIDTADTEGNVRVFINDSDDPIYDENPETGEYEDMSEQEVDE